jgi:sulfonate transport system substrate-binding protein
MAPFGSSVLGFAGTVVLIASLLLGAAVQAEPLVIRVGYAGVGVDNQPFANGTYAATARAAGYLEAEFHDEPEIRVDWKFFRGAGPAVNEAIANEQLDISYQGDLPAIIARASGLQTRLVLATSRAPLYVAVSAKSTLQGIKDLKGRRVALFRGTSGHLAAVKVLAANGLTERDLQIVNMDYAAAIAALATGGLDAVFGQNSLIGLEQDGIARVIYTTKGDDPRFGRNGHVVVTQSFATKHPELVQRVVKAFVQAAHWSSQEANRPALLDLWAKSGTPVDVLRKDLEGDKLVERNSPLIDDFIVEQYRVQAQQAKAYGLIRRDVDVAGWFDSRYLDAALKDLDLETFWARYDTAGKPLDR